MADQKQLDVANLGARRVQSPLPMSTAADDGIGDFVADDERVLPLPQEHERALGGWQAEWPTVAALTETLGSAVEGMAEVASGLTVDVARLKANLDATKGAVLAERATFLLAEKMGKAKAGALVEKALSQGGSFVEALGRLEVELADETAMLGYSPKFVDRLLADLKRR